MNFLNGLLLLVTAAECANILIVYETARRSHQIWIGELAEALVMKGHNITMGGSFSKAIEGSDRYHPITFEGIFLTHYKINNTEHLQSNPFKKLLLNEEYNYAICNRTYHSNGFNALWNYPDNFTFDLILIDLTFGPCLYPLIQRFGNPYTIGFTPSSLTPYLSEMFGNKGYPSYMGSTLLRSPLDTSFFGRVTNYLVTNLEIFYKRTFERNSLKHLASNLLNRTFSFEELENSISLLLVNDYALLNEPIAITPNIIPVGGMHIRKVEGLPGVHFYNNDTFTSVAIGKGGKSSFTFFADSRTMILNSIVDNAHQGIVFFSTGTDIQPSIFSQYTKNQFANAFIKLFQKTVIWKEKMAVEDYPFKDTASNILIHKWMPQNDLLGHLHTKLLITTGGTLSIQEAIYNGVPVVGVPIYDEHHKNMQFIVDNKLGLSLDYHNLTEENIYETVNTVLKNPIYLENMGKLAVKFRDQPQSPLQRALYWVEYALRHNATNGADFLNPKSRYMCSLSAYYVDVKLFLFLIVSYSVIFIVVVALKGLACIISKTKTSKPDKIKKAKKQ